MNTKVKKAILYVLGLIASAVISFYAVSSTIFYAWMNANGSWSAEKAAPWAFGSLAISIVFIIPFIYFIVKIFKLRNTANAT